MASQKKFGSAAPPKKEKAGVTPVADVRLIHRQTLRGALVRGGTVQRWLTNLSSCKSLSSECGFHRGRCVKVAVCVFAYFVFRLVFLLLVDTQVRFSSVVVAAGSCDRSCRPRLLPTHSFARYRWRLSSAALHGRCRRVDIWCEFLAERTTPSKSTCGWLESDSSHRIHGCIRVGPIGRDLDPP